MFNWVGLQFDDVLRTYVECETVLRAPVAQHVSFRFVAGNDYPRSLMGAIAHCRQTFLDAGYYQRTWAAYEKAGRVGPRPPLDPAMAELEPALAGKMPVVFEADTRDVVGTVHLGDEGRDWWWRQRAGQPAGVAARIVDGTEVTGSVV